MDEVRPDKPRVLALMGLPGAGKTTLAVALSRRLGWEIVSRDAIRKAMFRPCTYSEEEKRAANRATFQAVVRNVFAGKDSIVDGMTFSRPGQLEELAAEVVAHGGRLLPVFLDCPVRVAQERVEQARDEKQAMPADRDAQLVIRVAERFRDPPWDALVLHGDAPVEELVAEVVGWTEFSRRS